MKVGHVNLHSPCSCMWWTEEDATGATVGATLTNLVGFALGEAPTHIHTYIHC